jgi:tol-pal system protein YbgF
MNTLLRAALGGALLFASVSHAAVAPVEDATPSLSRPAPKAPRTAVVDGVPYQAPELILDAPEEPAVASPGVVFEQLQALQAEVMLLRGLVETQAKALERLEAAQRDRYLDLDRRVARLSGLAPATPAAPSAPVMETPGPATPVSGNEREAYEAAFALTRDKRFAEAIPAFKAFIEAYPAGAYIPNAWYWLGELHLALSNPDLEASRQAFVQVVSLWPEHPKVPDALYKLGVVYDQLGVASDATRYFQRVLAEHPDSAAARLTQSYLDRRGA